MAVDDGDRTKKTAADWSKRMLDLAGSAALLVLLSPLLLLITAVIKLTSKGPVLFRQVRIGQYEQPFTMLKFRTMHANADQAIHEAYTTEFIGSGLRHRAAPAPYSRSLTTRASRDWATSFVDQASTSCRSCGTCCLAPCRSSGQDPPFHTKWPAINGGIADG